MTVNAVFLAGSRETFICLFSKYTRLFLTTHAQGLWDDSLNHVVDAILIC